ncbi:hypothetical protein SU69_01185 [Thermosipho melanesiensis]|uniref:Uncharacterized protein n=2 Tax=Thermosipho melanesiensis TaxID=46541 RepID=A6LJJ5_THEM4|nr:hypothetical protein [Thermosipho melanesiensis]ABR30096.1 hypothetical protein Tmel_0222 [Thermosipho melanesiensis BI429]APT73293.1 hypothetical protein BW47_01225 [Thermosipho melanesiensis]OOC38684.1 hypothetical protein SU68_01185 [Thermosipho melanesiensis]OOC40488.1 hypothetical protein SU70_01185 [Thermosipho melanesiensis]OOC40753.1 hypothetical protein SU69_01185 [Thermosipho melanesiensis]
MIRNILIFLELVLVYIFSSFVLHVNKFTLSGYVISFFIMYFFIFSIIASLKGKAFLFSELSRLWFYSFVPMFVYIIFLINIRFHISIDSRLAFFPSFILSNFMNLNYEKRKGVAIFRLLAFFFFIFSGVN